MPLDGEGKRHGGLSAMPGGTVWVVVPCNRRAPPKYKAYESTTSSSNMSEFFSNARQLPIHYVTAVGVTLDLS
jgi:hypothetical protein